MLQKITMPAGGQTTDQLQIVKWHKKEGDKVNRGDVLLEVETDKATLEVESFAKGTLLRMVVNEGEVATVGDVVAYIGEEADLKELDETSGQKAEVEEENDFQPIMFQEEETAPKVLEQSDKKVMASPAAKKAIKDMRLDINEISKVINKNLIKRNDVLEYSSKFTKSAADSNESEFELIPLTSMRRVIASRMAESISTIPTFTAEVQVDMENCINLRKELNATPEDIRISYNDIIGKCVSVLIKKYPLINSSFADDGIKAYKAVNVGLAVSVDNGLVVPVVKNVQDKNLSQIAKENLENIAKARENKLEAEDMEEGTFTISNLGMYPIRRFTAIINPPQSCILAIGSIMTNICLQDGQVTTNKVMNITATFDHRVIDGAYGAQFLKDLKEILEHPVKLLL